MQNIRDDLLAKSVRDKIEQLEKEGVIKSDQTLNLNIQKSSSKLPFKSTFVILVLQVVFLIVVGYTTDNLSDRMYQQGSVMVIVAVSLAFFVLGYILNKLRQK